MNLKSILKIGLIGVFLLILGTIGSENWTAELILLPAVAISALVVVSSRLFSLKNGRIFHSLGSISLLIEFVLWLTLLAQVGSSNIPATGIFGPSWIPRVKIVEALALVFLSIALLVDWQRSLWSPESRFQRVIGILAGIMVIGSVLFPWTGVNISPGTALLQDSESLTSFIPQLIIVGGIISILSRYGSLVTITGLWRYLLVPVVLNCDTLGCPYSMIIQGPGFWFAIFGIIFATMGRPVNFDFLLGTRQPLEGQIKCRGNRVVTKEALTEPHWSFTTREEHDELETEYHSNRSFKDKLKVTPFSRAP